MRLNFMLFMASLLSSPALAAPKAPRGAADGPCYGNRTCNTGLRCVSRRCKPLAQGADGGKCYGNGTCDTGLACVNAQCQSASTQAGITWLNLPAGAFEMGSKTGSKDERPVHKVDIKAFQLAKTEVTVAQYKACVDAGICAPPQAGNKRCTAEFMNWDKAGREDHPINCVTWTDASTFAKWVGGRLPTEAEWEYASRSGGRESQYPWGDAPADCTRAVMSAHDPASAGCGRPGTWPVCGKASGNTKHGACDMAGNVWEWVEDAYATSYKKTPTDGSAYTGPSSYRTGRGGGWDNVASGVRATYRSSLAPETRGSALGFRPARTIADAD